MELSCPEIMIDCDEQKIKIILDNLFERGEVPAGRLFAFGRVKPPNWLSWILWTRGRAWMKRIARKYSTPFIRAARA